MTICICRSGAQWLCNLHKIATKLVGDCDLDRLDADYELCCPSDRPREPTARRARHSIGLMLGMQTARNCGRRSKSRRVGGMEKYQLIHYLGAKIATRLSTLYPGR
jgi:hypothetical protein